MLHKMTFCGPKQGNFNATDKEVLDSVPEKLEYGLPITTDTVWIKALEDAKSLKILWPDFKARWLGSKI